MPQRPKTDLSRNTRNARRVKLRRRKLKEEKLLFKYHELYSAKLPFQFDFNKNPSQFLMSIKNERGKEELDHNYATNSQYFLTTKTENTEEESDISHISHPSTSCNFINIKTEEYSYVSNPTTSPPVTIKIENTEDSYISDNTIKNTEVLDNVDQSTSQSYINIKVENTENSDPIDTQDLQTPLEDLMCKT